MELNYEVEDTITLDDSQEYVIVKKELIKDIEYLYLVTMTQPVEILLMKKVGENDFETITDAEEFNEIITQFITE